MVFPSPKKVVNPEPEQCITVDVPRAVATHKWCMICRSTRFQQDGIQEVSDQIRLHSFTKQNLYIPKGNRICKDHVKNKVILADCLKRIQIMSDTSEIPISDYQNFFQRLVKGQKNTFFERLANLELTEKEFKDVLGLSKEKFIELAEQIQLKDTRDATTGKGRNKNQALGVFLARMRTNMSQTLMARLFGIEQQLVSAYCQQVLQAFGPILHSKFGPKNVTKEEIITKHTTNIAKTLFGDNKVILIFDGTYSYTQKSNNFFFQRASYSVQKKSNLVKPFTVVTTTGLVLDFFGPFEATLNDAQILEKVLKTNTHLRELLIGGVAVLDRGFRDAVPYLKSLNITVKMPALKGKRKQFTTEEANVSRLVTKVRWVIEAIHGIVKKKYKYLDADRPTVELPNIGKYFRIAGFLQNTFGKPLASDDDDPRVAEKILKLVEKTNELKTFVEENKLVRRNSDFISIAADGLDNFPVLEKSELRDLFTGSYQLKLTASYLAEFLNRYEVPVIWWHKRDSLVKIKMPSRHSKNKEYVLFIKYEEYENSTEGILGWYCTCPNGARTVGPCCHVAAMIYYFSCAVYEEKTVTPASFLANVFNDDIPVVLNDDSDDEEDGEEEEDNDTEGEEDEDN